MKARVNTKTGRILQWGASVQEAQSDDELVVDAPDNENMVSLAKHMYVPDRHEFRRTTDDECVRITAELQALRALRG